MYISRGKVAVDSVLGLEKCHAVGRLGGNVILCSRVKLVPVVRYPKEGQEIAVGHKLGDDVPMCGPHRKRAVTTTTTTTTKSVAGGDTHRKNRPGGWGVPMQARVQARGTARRRWVSCTHMGRSVLHTPINLTRLGCLHAHCMIHGRVYWGGGGLTLVTRQFWQPLHHAGHLHEAKHSAASKSLLKFS